MAFAHRIGLSLLLVVVLACASQCYGKALQAPVTAAPAIASDQTPPPAPAYSLPPEKLAKAIKLNRIRNVLDVGSSAWAVIFLWLLLATGAAAALDRFTQRTTRRRWLQGVIFYAVFLLSTTLAGLPFELYGHHVSRAYSISVQGWASWFGDLAKSLGLTLLLGVPVLLLFNWLAMRWPRRFWLGAWLIMLPLMAASVFVEPLLEPIFNPYEPLSRSHPGLVNKLETVAERTKANIPPGRMFLMDASAKTNGLNAYVSGIGATRRIVVWDTTAGRIPDDEVLFIFGHESGHYVLNHIPKMLGIAAVALFFLFWACAAIARRLAKRFDVGLGTHASRDSMLGGRAGFMVLIFTVSLAAFVLTPIANAVSRHYEHQADVYGQEAIHGLVADPRRTAVSSFNHLGEAWLEDPNPSPLVEFWLYDHPSVKNRAEFAAHYDPWTKGGRGEFFDK